MESVESPEHYLDIEQRNKNILLAVEDEKFPMLPFEYTLLTNKLSGYEEIQRELGARLAEAMSQSSETWHDNAPADAINADSTILYAQAIKVISTLRNAEICKYTPNHERVTLGSIIGIRHGVEDAQSEYYMMTGVVRELGDDVVEHLPSETIAVTFNSPLGAALFDKKIGDHTSYTVGDRRIEVIIDSIDAFNSKIESHIA